MVELDRSDEFEITDANFEKIKNLYGKMEVVFSKYSEKSKSKHDEWKNGIVYSERSYVNRALFLPKIELQKFDGITVQLRSFYYIFT